MLTSAHIKNFRSCKDVKLDNLGHMVALVGRNGAGKTTILRALEWVAETALASDTFDLIDEVDLHASTVSFAEIQFEALHHQYRFRFGPDPQGGEHSTDQESLSIRSTSDGTWQDIYVRINESVHVGVDRRPIELNRFTAAMPALSSVLPRSDPLQTHLRAVTDALQRVRYYPGQLVFYPADAIDEEPSGPIAEDVYDRWVAANKFGPRRTSLLLRIIHAHARRPAVFAEIKQLMGPVGLNLLHDIHVVSIGDVEPLKPHSGRPHRYFDVRFAPSESSAELTLQQLSGGTRHALYLLLGLLYDDNSTMLIEQPEDGIHPGLLTKLIDLLRVNADPAQIILTSHSPVVLSSLQASDIRLVDIHDDSTTVRALSPAEIQRAQEYMQRDGTLAEFLELIQE